MTCRGKVYEIGDVITLRLCKKRRISYDVLNFINNIDEDPGFVLNDELLKALEVYVKLKKHGKSLDQVLAETNNKIDKESDKKLVSDTATIDNTNENAQDSGEDDIFSTSERKVKSTRPNEALRKAFSSIHR